MADGKSVEHSTGPAQVRVVIDLDTRTGRVNVTGPIDNKLLVLGMFAVAADIVHKFDPAKASGLVQPVPKWVG